MLDWTRVVVGKVSSWINLDSTLEAERQLSEEVLYCDFPAPPASSCPLPLVPLNDYRAQRGI